MFLDSIKVEVIDEALCGGFSKLRQCLNGRRHTRNVLDLSIWFSYAPQLQAALTRSLGKPHVSKKAFNILPFGYEIYKEGGVAADRILTIRYPGCVCYG